MINLNIIDNNNIKIVSTYLLPYLAKKGVKENKFKRYRCINPTHHDSHPSMSYYIGKYDYKPRLRCNACGKVWDLYNLIEHFENITNLKSQYYFICSLLGINHVDPTPYVGYTNYRSDLKEEDLKDFLENCVSNSIHWQKRGISIDTQKSYHLGYHKYHNSLVIPVKSPKNKIIGYIERFIYPDTPEIKYKRSKGLQQPFNIQALESNKPIFITEGEIDALSIIQCNYTNVFSIGGASNLKRWLIPLLKRSVKRIVSTFDLDNAGYNATAICKDLCFKYNVDYSNIWDYLPYKNNLKIKDINDMLLHDETRLKQVITILSR